MCPNPRRPHRFHRPHRPQKPPSPRPLSPPPDCSTPPPPPVPKPRRPHRPYPLTALTALSAPGKRGASSCERQPAEEWQEPSEKKVHREFLGNQCLEDAHAPASASRNKGTKRRDWLEAEMNFLKKDGRWIGRRCESARWASTLFAADNIIVVILTTRSSSSE